MSAKPVAKKFRGRLVVFLITLGFLGLLGYLISGPHSPPLNYRSHIAIPGSQSSALVILAQEKGFFRAEGIYVTLEYKATARECLALVVAGGADLAVVFETPITRSILEGNNIGVLTELHRSEQNTAIVARKDRGIHEAKHLIGKTIATVSESNAEFHLDLFLRSNMIDARKVKRKPMSISEAVEAVAKGRVDAAALWQPYVSQSVHANPANFVLLKSSFYSEFSMLAGLHENLESQRDANLAILRALLRAQKYFDNKNNEAKILVDGVLAAEGFFVSPAAWDQMDVHLGLSATLLTMFNIEADWYRADNGLSSNMKMEKTFDGQYLKNLAPDLVTYE